MISVWLSEALPRQHHSKQISRHALCSLQLCDAMPLFPNKFSPKKTPTRKALAFLNKNLSPRRIEKELGPEVGPIRLRLGDQEAIFEAGLWIPESGKIGGTFKENEKLKKEMRRLEEENNLLKLKFDVLLDMLAQTTAETRQKEELGRLKNSFSHNKKVIT